MKGNDVSALARYVLLGVHEECIIEPYVECTAILDIEEPSGRVLMGGKLVFDLEIRQKVQVFRDLKRSYLDL